MKKPAAYNHLKIEKKWQKKWATSNIYKSKEDAKKDKFYVLDMFPYPSGEGLHVGHPKGYIATDIISRMKRMQGHSVLHPMGFDAFGLPAENYALKTKTNPEISVKKNVVRYKEQLQLLGCDYDWSREINTTDPKYYKWTQWIFLQMFKKGLAYESFEPINWCPSCKTGLANEDVEDGRCERCGTLVEKKPMRQWVLKITDYAERLLKDLEAYDTKSLPHLIDKKNPPRPGKKSVERRTIQALVRDPKTGKFLGLKWHKHPWTTFIVGGVDDGEDIVEAARREVAEETGYTDIKFVQVLGSPVCAEYFAAHKDQNRVAITSGVLFELVSDKKIETSKETHEDFENIWLDPDKEMTEEVMTCAELPVWLERLPSSVLDESGPVPCITQVWEPGTVRADKPFVERSAIVAIVKHWKEDKYIGLKWKKVAWQTLITGGIEKGQTAEQAAMAEILEETGYTHPKLIRKLGKVDAKFFHIPKDQNRWAHFEAMYFELQDDERRELSVEEQANHEVVWVNREDMATFIGSMGQKYTWTTMMWGKKAEFPNDVKPLLDWPQSIVKSQKDWIGKSEGALINFKLDGMAAQIGTSGEKTSAAATKNIEVFTTRPDTLFGVTYVVLAPEHKLVGELLGQAKNRKEVEAYISRAKNETEIERTDATKEKTGVELSGISAINPATGEKVSVWISDYVLADYGTGAVMAVPAHDERDFQFAKKFGLAVKNVIIPDFVDDTPGGAPRSDKPTSVRASITAVIKHWSEDKYMILDWKKTPRKTFLTGGIEKGEDPVVSATREIIEETGYTDIKFVKNLGEAHGHFFASWKNENHLTHITGLLFKLNSDSKKEVSKAELEKHDFRWVSSADVVSTLNQTEHDIRFSLYFWANMNKPGAYIDDGILVNSGKFNGRESLTIKKEITDFVHGKWVTKYKLRDWVFSRQRYWGEPIPVVHCERHDAVPVPEKELPVKLPKVKSYEPTGTGESPLAAIDKWVNTTCPKCVEEKKAPKYFIFDFDGVLGDTWQAAITARVRMGHKEKDVVAEMLKYFNKKPHHTRDSVRTQEQIDEDLSWTGKFGEEMIKEKFALFNGFIAEIKKYKKAKYAVVSSGSNIYVKPSLKKSGLKFDHILTFEDHHSKEEKIEQICKDWGVDVKDVYYFTDTKADVYELENFLDRDKLIGCAWGFSGLEMLKEVLPEKQILKDFKDLRRFFNSDCKAKRETNTMPQWAGSSWYYLRYEDPKNDKALVDVKKERHWSPVDFYVGGAEHATRHLIYARFWHKFLYDIGVVSNIEPFKKLQHVGLIMGQDDRKMSKRFGNVVNPDDVVKVYGADTLRVYEMFMGPFDQQISWSTDSMVGARRFIEKVWRLAEKTENGHKDDPQQTEKIIHKTIKKVGDDIIAMRFNTAISSLMIAVNELEKTGVNREQFESLLKLLAPFAPHVTEELWSNLGNKSSIHTALWPEYKPELALENKAKIAVQVNGKVRGIFEIDSETAQSSEPEAIEAMKTAAQALPEVKKWTEGKDIKKIIVIKGKIVSIVI